MGKAGVFRCLGWSALYIGNPSNVSWRWGASTELENDVSAWKAGSPDQVFIGCRSNRTEIGKRISEVSRGIRHIDAPIRKELCGYRERHGVSLYDPCVCLCTLPVCGPTYEASTHASRASLLEARCGISAECKFGTRVDREKVSGNSNGSTFFTTRCLSASILTLPPYPKTPTATAAPTIHAIFTGNRDLPQFPSAPDTGCVRAFAGSPATVTAFRASLLPTLTPRPSLFTSATPFFSGW